MRGGNLNAEFTPQLASPAAVAQLFVGRDTTTQIERMNNRKRILLAGLVFLIACAFVLASAGKRRAESLSCASTVTALSLASRVWAEDNGGVCAVNFVCMSNELSTPKILVCPSDHQRQKAGDWASFTPAYCSYEIISPGLRVEETNAAFLRCKVHGHLGYTDGTVFDGHRRRHKYE